MPSYNALGTYPLIDILHENEVTMDDGVTEFEPMEQTADVEQGDNLSPLVFSVAISDLSSVIVELHRQVKRRALATLKSCVDDVVLEVNLIVRNTEAIW